MYIVTKLVFNICIKSTDIKNILCKILDSHPEQSLGSDGTPAKQDLIKTPAREEASEAPGQPESKLKLSFVADSSGASSSSQSKVHRSVIAQLLEPIKVVSNS